ncbi:MAG: PQQ-dependent sugar dehydrogenase [Trueperaceae bacterium]
MPAAQRSLARRGAGASALIAVAAMAALAAASVPLATPSRPAPRAYALAPWFDGLRLPVAVVAVPDHPDRWLAVQLEGLLIDVRDGVPREPPFLDLRHRVTGLEGEQGLFSAALEPRDRALARDRARHVVAAFSERDTGDLVVAAYPIDEAAWLADGTAEVEVLRVPMPDPFHHGGFVRFGPDGLLFATIGDGSAAIDPAVERSGGAASPSVWRGKVVRVELLPTADRAPAYLVPADNPFASGRAATGGAARPEVWAYGFRNPWKLTFDPATGEAIVADVGADRWEEVHRVVPGGDHGWPAREGRECVLLPDGTLLDPTCGERADVAPWIAYGHLALDPDGGQAVVGGVVVRDPQLPELAGRYVFGDFVSGRVWAYDPVADRRELLVDAGPGISAVDEGPRGEVLIVTLAGSVRRLVRER